jgi:hypothetical protein
MPTGPDPDAAQFEIRAADLDDTQRELTALLARIVVSREAAEELPIFRATSDAYFETPDSVLRRVVGKDETLGFGGEALAALTPFALAVSSTVVKFLADQALIIVGDAGRQAAVELVRGWLARLRSDKSASKGEPSLTAEQLSRVRAVAFDKGRQLELSERESALLADAVVGSLATSV